MNEGKHNIDILRWRRSVLWIILIFPIINFIENFYSTYI